VELTPIVLEGSHVRLEPLRRDHIPGLCEIGLDPELWRWTAATARTGEEMTAYVESALVQQAEGHCLPFATLERSSRRIVGTTRLGNWQPQHRRVEIGWTLVARAWQRTAINTEAKLLMLRHAFGPLAVNRVELKTDALNEISRRAIERLGAKQEGILRQHVVTWTGRVRDTVFYGIVREEWPEVEARLVRSLGSR
jgi:RimJ/RimL family protein N-acetyltransferase